MELLFCINIKVVRMSKYISFVLMIICCYFLQESVFEVLYYLVESQKKYLFDGIPFYPLRITKKHRDVKTVDIIFLVIKTALCIVLLFIGIYLFEISFSYLYQSFCIISSSVVIAHITYFFIHGLDPGETHEETLECMYRNVKISLLLSLVLCIFLIRCFGVSCILRVFICSIFVGIVWILTYW